jgi:hypothetical protein
MRVPRCATGFGAFYSPYAFYDTDKRGQYSVGGCNKGRNRCPSASQRTAAGHTSEETIDSSMQKYA